MQPQKGLDVYGGRDAVVVALPCSVEKLVAARKQWHTLEGEALRTARRVGLARDDTMRRGGCVRLGVHIEQPDTGVWVPLGEDASQQPAYCGEISGPRAATRTLRPRCQGAWCCHHTAAAAHVPRRPVRGCADAVPCPQPPVVPRPPLCRHLLAAAAPPLLPADLDHCRGRAAVAPPPLFC